MLIACMQKIVCIYSQSHLPDVGVRYANIQYVDSMYAYDRVHIVKYTYHLAHDVGVRYAN